MPGTVLTCYLSRPAAETGSFCGFADADHVSSETHIDIAGFGRVIDVLESLGHLLVELLVDFFFRPVVALVVLNPFEVGGRDTTGTCKNIRNEEDSALGRSEERR